MIDAAHHESRVLRAQLVFTNVKVQEAKSRRPFTPQRSPPAHIQQDWSSPSSHVDLEGEYTIGDGAYQFEEMKAKLLEFEHNRDRSGFSSREKGFFAALRSLLLEITTSRSSKEAGLRIIGAHKWFVKNRPRGKAEDPAIFAALATSLSLASLASHKNQAAQHQINPREKGSFIGSHSPHDFYAPFSSKVSDKILSTGVSRMEMLSKTSGLSKGVNHLVSQNAFSLPVVLAPSTALVPKTKASIAYHDTIRESTSDREEMDHLRRRYCAMDTSANNLTASVERQVELWSLNRARMEEEIIRRQEASRYASPSVFSSQMRMSNPEASDGMETISAYHQQTSSRDEDPNEGGRVGGNSSLSYLTSIVASARDARHRSAADFEVEKQKISNRIPSLAADSALDRALRPVPDKSYLECIAKLPRPDDLKAEGDKSKVLPSKANLIKSSKKGVQKRS